MPPKRIGELQQQFSRYSPKISPEIPLGIFPAIPLGFNQELLMQFFSDYFRNSSGYLVLFYKFLRDPSRKFTEIPKNIQWFLKKFPRDTTRNLFRNSPDISTGILQWFVNKFSRYFYKNIPGNPQKVLQIFLLRRPRDSSRNSPTIPPWTEEECFEDS